MRRVDAETNNSASITQAATLAAVPDLTITNLAVTPNTMSIPQLAIDFLRDVNQGSGRP